MSLVHLTPRALPSINFWRKWDGPSWSTAECLSSIVANHSGKQKKLYKLVDSWLGREKEKERSLHYHESASNLASSFSSFFHDKVETISTTLAIERSTIDPDLVLKLDPFQFGIFSIWYLSSEVRAWFGDSTSQET